MNPRDENIVMRNWWTAWKVKQESKYMEPGDGNVEKDKG